MKLLETEKQQALINTLNKIKDSYDLSQTDYDDLVFWLEDLRPKRIRKIKERLDTVE